MAQPRSYWQKRFELLEDMQYNKSASYNKDLEKAYIQTMKEIEKDIARWYQRFATNNEISLGEAKQLLRTNELKELQWSVEDYIKYGKENALNQKWMKQLENASSRVHISRLESLQLQLQQHVEMLYGEQIEGFERLMKETYQDQYYHAAYEIQKGFEVGFTLQALDEVQLSKVISKPWTADGTTFSGKVWRDKNLLLDTLHTELIQSIVRGESPQRMISVIQNKMNTSRSNATRLVMTESAFFSASAQKDAFKTLDVEQYEIIATLDGRTSDICQSMDGKVFALSDFEPGVTANPFHPRCRTTTAPFFEDDNSQRIARGDDGKTYHVPSNMTYKEWYDKTIISNPDALIEEKKRKNLSSDKEQLAKYKKALGNEAPSSIASFQEIKYNDSETYNSLKRKFKEKNTSIDEQFSYLANGKKEFIPSNSRFTHTKAIAGKGSNTDIRVVDKLVEKYGGSKEDWSKKVGKIESGKYIFDLHWYELNGKQYEMKLKHRKENLGEG